MTETNYTSWKQNNAYFEVNDEMLVKSTNFEKVGDFFDNNKTLLSKTNTVSRMPNNKIKSYLQKHLFENYKFDNIKKSIRRDCLTDHTKPYNSSYLYNHIINYCFDGNDIKSFSKIKKIDNFEEIKQIYDINPSFSGTLIDYLTRRIICEMRGQEFKDDRAELVIATSTPTEHMEAAAERMEALDPAYKKCKNVSEFKTEDILEEIFLVSTAHNEFFNETLPQDKFDQINNIITSLDSNAFTNHFRNIYTEIIENVPSDKIIPNPVCGGDKFKCGADADLIIDDCLGEMKVTNGKKESGEILQLLGYAAMLRFNKNIVIKHIFIINYLLGEIKFYNIEWITENQLRTYIDLIDKDEYDKNKKISYRPIPNFYENFPDFMGANKNPVKSLRCSTLEEIILVQQWKELEIKKYNMDNTRECDGCLASFSVEKYHDYGDELGWY